MSAVASQFLSVAQLPYPDSSSAPTVQELRDLFAVPAQPRITFQNLDGPRLLRQFENRLAASNPRFEKIASDNTLIGSYAPFMVAPEGGGLTYTHALKYTTHEGVIPLSPQRIQMAIHHEGNHVFELEDTLDGWATRYNMASLYCLEAEERAIYVLLSELNAFGHEGLLTTIEVLNNPERAKLLQLFETTSEDELRGLRRDYPDVACAIRFLEVNAETERKGEDLGMAVRNFGLEVLSRNKAVNIGQPNITMFDHYCGDVLADYESKNLFGSYTPSFVFTRLSPGVKNMGNGLGLNIFENRFEDLVAELRSRFSPDTRARLDALKTKLGVNKNSMQTTEEAVENSGETWGQYIRRSKEYVYVPPAPPENTQEAAEANPPVLAAYT